MKFNVLILLIIAGFQLVSLINCIPPKKSFIQVKEGDPPGGYWRTKSQWKAYWVKSWEPKVIYVPVWKKIWGPVNIKEWVPLPHPPPGWKQ